MKIKVGVVDDHKIVRRGLGIIFESAGFEISFEAHDGIDMIDKLKKIPKSKIPDIITLDISMPIMNGYETAEWLKSYYPNIKVIIVTMFDDENSIIRMLKLGAKAYINKDTDVKKFIEIINHVYEKGMYYTESMNTALLKNLRGEGEKGSQIISKLSENEIKILKLFSTELTYSEIAKEMNISVRTVDGYKESIFSKLGLKTRVGVVVYAIKNNIIKLDND